MKTITAIAALFALTSIGQAASGCNSASHSLGWTCTNDTVTARTFEQSHKADRPDEPGEPNDGDGDKGHGNDPYGYDGDNPGKSEGSKGRGRK